MRALGFDVKKADVLKILKDYDREATGKITFDDFNEVVTDWILDRDPHEEILKAFKLFDDDDSGKISLRNLRRVARELGENMSDEELRAMIEEFDKDGDGENEEAKTPSGLVPLPQSQYMTEAELKHRLPQCERRCFTL
ncbi:centrin-3 isoform X3 [Erinaceus europaeus]|nr:centrin-3 isoform X3 [Erinaceus europaeus]